MNKRGTISMLLGMAVMSTQAVPPLRINIHPAQDGVQLELYEISSEIGYRLQKTTALQAANWADIAVIQSPKSEYALWVDHVEDVAFFRAVSTVNGAANALVLDALSGRQADDRVLRRETNGAISGAFSSGPFLVELPGKIPPDGMGGQRLSFPVSGASLTFDLPYGDGHEAVSLHPVDLVLSVDANNLSDIRINAAAWSGNSTVMVAGAPFILTDLGSISVGSDGVMYGEIELSKYGGDPVEIQPGVWLTGCTGTATADGIEPARLKVDFSQLSGVGLAILNAEGRQVAEGGFMPLGSHTGTLHYEPFHLPIGVTNGVTVTNMQVHVYVRPGEPVPMKVNHVSAEIKIDQVEAWPPTALAFDSDTGEFRASMLDAFVYEKTEADPEPWSVSCELQPLSAVLTSNNVEFEFNGASLGLTNGPSSLQLSVEPEEPDLLRLALKGLLKIESFMEEAKTNWPSMLLDLGANGLKLSYNSNSNQWDWSAFSAIAALDGFEFDIIGNPLEKSILLTGSGSLSTNLAGYAISLVISNFSYSLSTDPESLDTETGLESIQLDLTMSRESGAEVLRAGLTVSPEEAYLYMESFDTISITNEDAGIVLTVSDLELDYDLAANVFWTCQGVLRFEKDGPTHVVAATWSLDPFSQLITLTGSAALTHVLGDYELGIAIDNVALTIDPNSEPRVQLDAIDLEAALTEPSGREVLRGSCIVNSEEGFVQLESLEPIAVTNEASGIGLRIDAIALNYDLAEESLLACSGSIAVTGDHPTNAITARWSMDPAANLMIGSVGGRISITESNTCWLDITPFDFSHDDWQGLRWLSNPGGSAGFTGETAHVAMSLDYDVATEVATLSAAGALDIQTDDGFGIKTTLNELVVESTTNAPLKALRFETALSHAIGTGFVRAIKAPDASALELSGTVEMDTAEAENGIAFTIQNGTFSAVLDEEGLRNVVRTGVCSIFINGVQYGLLDFSR